MIHINYTKTDDRQIVRKHCPDCGKRSYFACFFQNWYGWSSTCMRCGRRFEDGEWMPLAFMPKSREVNKSEARKRWKRRR